MIEGGGGTQIPPSRLRREPANFEFAAWRFADKRQAEDEAQIGANGHFTTWSLLSVVESYWASHVGDGVHIHIPLSTDKYQKFTKRRAHQNNIPTQKSTKQSNA